MGFNSGLKGLNSSRPNLMFSYTTCTPIFTLYIKGKGKAIPLQALKVPAG
jgi:hypothetical protein